MTVEIPHVIEAYEKAINEDRIIGSECTVCHHVAVPPRPVCKKCGHMEYSLVDVEAVGVLETWTVIYISPPTYMDLAPYTLGIVKLANGEALTGIIVAPPEKLAVGMKVRATFDAEIKNAGRLRWVLVDE